MIKPLRILVLTISFLAPVAQAAEPDKTSIIRALAPIRYLPQHSNETRAIDLDIRFKSGSADLTTEARRQLGVVADALRDRWLRGEQFRIVGHTDATGTAAMNLRLSLVRARAVRQFLVRHGGIGEQRLHAHGEGETRLKNPLAPASRENRRVEFVLIQSAAAPARAPNKSGKERTIKW